jgi:hypothetical protein
MANAYKMYDIPLLNAMYFNSWTTMWFAPYIPRYRVVERFRNVVLKYRSQDRPEEHERRLERTMGMRLAESGTFVCVD